MDGQIPQNHGNWALLPPDKLITKLGDRENQYYETLRRRGYFAIWSIMMEEYYGMSSAAQSFGFEAGGVSFEGEDEEWLRFRVAEMRSLVKQQIAIQIRERPEFEGVAINLDYESMAQVKASEAGVQYLYEQQYGSHKELDLAEQAKLFALSFTWLRWDQHEGPEVDVEQPVDPEGGELEPEFMAQVEQPSALGKASTGVKAPTGLPVARVMSPWDVIHDPTKKDPDDHDWFVVRERRGRWEVLALMQQALDAAQDSATRSQIATAMDKVSHYKVTQERLWETLFGFDRNHNYDDDLIVKHFYRRRSVAVPEGRHLMYVGKTPIADGPLEGPTMPVIPLPSSLLIGTSVGYSDAWDLIVLQQMLTDLASSTGTSISTHGNPALVMDKGTDIDADALVNNTMLLTKPKGADMPAYLVPPSMRADQRWFFDWVGQRLMAMAKLNDVVRGNPGENVSSGTYAALLHSIAIDNMGEEELHLKLHRERVADTMLAMMRTEASHGMLVEVTGRDERAHVELMKSEDLGAIHRVKMKAIPAAKRNPGLRQQMVEWLLQIPGAIEDPAQIITYIETGQWKAITNPVMSENLRMQWENDELGEGVPVQVITEKIMTPMGEVMEPFEITPSVPVFMFDDHPRHIKQAISVLNSPQAFMHEPVRKGVFVHVMWHLRVWRQMPPDLAMALGVPALSAQVEQQMDGAMQAMMGGGKGDAEPPGEPKETERVGETETPLPKPAQPAERNQ